MIRMVKSMCNILIKKEKLCIICISVIDGQEDIKNKQKIMTIPIDRC